jgi:hypothetical protein
MTSTRNATGTSTCAIELQKSRSEVPDSRQYSTGKGKDHDGLADETGQRLGSSPEEPPTGVEVAHSLEKWNAPAHNIPRTFATFLSFVVMGANDAAYGVRSTSSCLN